MAQTFVAPANVTIEATALPGSQLAKVAFYSTSVTPRGDSVCQSLNELDAAWNSTSSGGQGTPTRIGETTAAPQRLIWNVTTPGVYDVRAVATYRSGLQQISPPTVIVVNSDVDHESDNWQGWRPSYPTQQIRVDPNLMPAPTPTQHIKSAARLILRRPPVHS